MVPQTQCCKSKKICIQNTPPGAFEKPNKEINMTLEEQLRRESVEEYKGYFFQALNDKFIVAYESWQKEVAYIIDTNYKVVRFDNIELAKEAIDEELDFLNSLTGYL